MMSFLKGITPAQWIMISTLAVISGLMLMATSAHAAPYGAVQGTTLGHCGWLNADSRLYTHSSRNVRIIQTKLTGMGYSVGRAGLDGKFGPATRAAIAEFQRDHGLQPDGQVGGFTATRLAYATHPIANVRRCKRPYAMN